MTKEIAVYAQEQLNKSGIQIVPGHHPDFKNKKEVDGWIRMMNFFAKESFDDAFKENEKC